MITCALKGLRPIAFRLEHGENLNTALEDFVVTSGVGFAYLPGMVGQFDEVELGFFDPESGLYTFRKLPRPQSEDEKPNSRLEPTVISANVSWSGHQPFAHVHGGFASGFSDHGGRFVGGGHISRAVVGRTAEGVLFVTDDITVVRVMDLDPDCRVRVWHFEARRS
ncbi:MAG: DUF296 domain-containing protein [Patescibacteria group bacterium]|jgi:predicted DNA-binding protein with PD1-like motif